jgi:uncharacterized protein YraI
MKQLQPITRITMILLVFTLACGLFALPAPSIFAAAEADSPISVSNNPAFQANPWSVEYFNNRTFTAPAVLGPSLPGGPLNLNWGLASPIAGINPDNWSSRFTSTVNFPTGGNITFEAKADDTVTVRVDGAAVTASAPYFVDTTYRGSVTLAAGLHTIVVEHTDIEREAYLYVNWSGGGGGTVGSPTGVTGTVISGSGLRFRDGPSTTANRIGLLPFGQTYPILGRNADGSWAYLEANGVRGWAFAALLSFNGNFAGVPIVTGVTPGPVPTNPVMTAYARTSVRLRTCPSTQCERIGAVPFGGAVNVFGQSADGQWIRIRYTSTTGAVLDGWSFKSLYRDANSQPLPANLPVVQ